MDIVNNIALILAAIGAINWGLVALVKIDLVATVGGGSDGTIAKVLYIVVGISGILALINFFTG